MSLVGVVARIRFTRLQGTSEAVIIFYVYPSVKHVCPSFLHFENNRIVFYMFSLIICRMDGENFLFQFAFEMAKCQNLDQPSIKSND